MEAVLLGLEYLEVAAAVLVYYLATQGRDLVLLAVLVVFMAYLSVM
jgi:hypothetical protein